MEPFNVYPVQDINIVKALGSRVWDENGHEYLDMYGGHAVISLGHTHPHWVKRIEAQLHAIAFYSNSIRIPIQRELAEKLGQVSGKEDYALFLCNSGAEANENALKLASFYNGRKKVVAFRKSFHGRTSLAVAATDSPAYVAPVNQTDHVIFLPFNDEAALEACFASHGKEISSVIIEGIQGVGGINEASPSFLRSIRRLCDEFGSVYIADSVQCGHGRSGEFFAHDYAGVQADIYSMAKGMGNGFPIGGIAIAPHLPAKHFQLGTTFGGNHLACAAGLAVLEIMEKENLMANARKMGEKLMAGLREIPGLENIRGRGLMIGFDTTEPLRDLKKNLLFRHRIFTGEAKPNVIRLLPSLALTEEDANLFLKAIQTEANELLSQS